MRPVIGAHTDAPPTGVNPTRQKYSISGGGGRDFSREHTLHERTPRRRRNYRQRLDKLAGALNFETNRVGTYTYESIGSSRLLFKWRPSVMSGGNNGNRLPLMIPRIGRRNNKYVRNNIVGSVRSPRKLTERVLFITRSFRTKLCARLCLRPRLLNSTFVEDRLLPINLSSRKLVFVLPPCIILPLCNPFQRLITIARPSMSRVFFFFFFLFF